jgi:hypothetical protein
MKRIIKLTERDLTRIVKRVIKEQDEELDFTSSKGNNQLNNIFNEIESMSKYANDSHQFNNMMDEFYENYKEDIEGLTDDEYVKLEDFIVNTYRDVRLHRYDRNNNMSDDELIDADDY